MAAVITENLVCMPTLSTEENDRGGLEVAERRVLDRKAEQRVVRRPGAVLAGERSALVRKSKARYRKP